MKYSTFCLKAIHQSVSLLFVDVNKGSLTKQVCNILDYPSIVQQKNCIVSVGNIISVSTAQLPDKINGKFQIPANLFRSPHPTTHNQIKLASSYNLGLSFYIIQLPQYVNNVTKVFRKYYFLVIILCKYQLQCGSIIIQCL